MSDQVLATTISRIQEGDTAAYRELFAMLAPILFAYVRYRVVDQEAADDLVQDSLIALFQSLSQFVWQSDAQFYKYLYTITKRQLAHYYGNKHVLAKATESDVPEEFWQAPVPDEAVSTDVARALGQLDAVTRDIMVLHYWSRHTFAEVGVILGLSEAAVRTRHHRAKETLTSLLT